ncbi:MAG: stealth family protein, partial [Bacteroides sp.]|nr:stealth family protein [Bacteroides sp.]
MDIDFVVTWVDMDDPIWKKDFAKAKGIIDNSQNQFSEARFRDYGFLKYWFRGVEKFSPWVRKIHFVTCGQKPDWLDVTNPKLHLVSHKDYIPEKYLPTFNSTVLEFYLDRIPELSEHFVYFNDDFYLTRPTGPERFFAPNGLPHDIAVFRMNTGLSLWSKTLRNNVRLINKHFDKKEVLKRDHDKWFCDEYGSKANLTRLMSFYNKFLTLRIPHNAQPYLKSTFSHVWAACRPELEEASTH